PRSANGFPAASVPIVPRTFGGTLPSSAMRDTFPVAAVGVTFTVAVNAAPPGEPPVAVVTVVVVAVRIALLQLVSRFPTLIVPNPVAKSYPGTAWNAGFPLSLL